MSESEELLPAPIPLIDTCIYTIRGQRVMLDSDLAEVYQVSTKQLNQAVKRNERRFPEAFSFQLTKNEENILRSHIVTSSLEHGGRRYLPRVFTEHGAVMLASVLNSDRAVAASIAIVDAFVRLRGVLDANLDLAKKVDKLAETVDEHGKAITVIFRELDDLRMTGIPERPKERIGFKVKP